MLTVRVLEFPLFKIITVGINHVLSFVDNSDRNMRK